MKTKKLIESIKTDENGEAIFEYKENKPQELTIIAKSGDVISEEITISFNNNQS